uniref:Pinin_SDK_memA domain-containing protein n=1 Tax=Caenorhabditis japonica TaxID=281687 RepID=A0A8R1DYG6_CAEJA
MEKMLVEDLEQDINVARSNLRTIDEKVTSLSGRVPRARISYNDEPEDVPLRNIERGTFGLSEEITSKKNRTSQQQQPLQIGNRRRISIEDRIDRRISGGRQSFDHLPKRQRPDYLDDEVEEDDYGKKAKRSIQSTVVMPALDSKGREDKIEKLKETENKDSKQRNRRLFSNLLMGTLSTFKKTEKKTAQQEKQEEVEKKLEETKKQELDARREEKHELLSKRREQEKELQSLQRKKALIQYAEHKISQLKFMKGAIKTSMEPHIYWQPKKHTVRSLELKQATERELDDLISEREKQLKDDLETRARQISEERTGQIEGENGELDEYEEEENEKNENEEIEVVLKNDEDVNREAEEEEEEKEEEIDVHVELD